MSMGGQGGGQPPKYLMLFVYKLNFIIDSLRKTPGAINSTVICKRKQRLGGSGGGGQINSSYSKLLNLHLSCRSCGKAHRSGNNPFPDEHILFQLLISQWKLGFYHLL